MSVQETKPQSVFQKTREQMWDRHRVVIRMRDKIVGGVPRDPDVISGWLKARAGVKEPDDLAQFAERTAVENGDYEIDGIPPDELRRTNGFKRDDVGGLYIESRQVKAMIKEAGNIIFAGDKWGKTKKGTKSWVAERIFVYPARIYIGREDADELMTFIGHISGPQGTRPTLSQYEAVSNAEIEFEIHSLVKDVLKDEDWAKLWVAAEENGLGTLRSQGYGQFDVITWEKMD